MNNGAGTKASVSLQLKNSLKKWGAFPRTAGRGNRVLRGFRGCATRPKAGPSTPWRGFPFRRFLYC